MQYIIEESIAYGIEKIVAITGENKFSMENHFDKSIGLELELEKSGETELLEIERNISDIVLNKMYVKQNFV